MSNTTVCAVVSVSATASLCAWATVFANAIATAGAVVDTEYIHETEAFRPTACTAIIIGARGKKARSYVQFKPLSFRMPKIRRPKVKTPGGVLGVVDRLKGPTGTFGVKRKRSFCAVSRCMHRYCTLGLA